MDLVLYGIEPNVPNMVSFCTGISKNKREITVRVLWNVVMPERSSEARASRQGENAPVYKNLTRFFFGGERVRVAVGCGEDVGRGSMARVSKTWKNVPANTSCLLDVVKVSVEALWLELARQEERASHHLPLRLQ